MDAASAFQYDKDGPPGLLPFMEETFRAVNESLDAGVRGFEKTRPHARELAISIARALHDARSSQIPRPRSKTRSLPLNLPSKAIFAQVSFSPTGVFCENITPVGPGRFVFGDDLDIFGEWNALASSFDGNKSSLIPAHGGEIIPGKLDDHVQQLRENFKDGSRRPVQVDMDISMACPSSCKFCFSSDYRASRASGRLMAPRLLLNQIEQWALMGVKVIRFDGGGDPLTHPALLTAIAQCHSADMRTAVLTAGDLLSKRHFECFISARTYVRISLNAATDATRRTLHGQRDNRYGVRRIYETAANLVAQRDSRLGRETPRQMLIGATSMIHPDNLSETVAIARAAKDAGFDHLSFRVVLGAEHRVLFSKSDRAELSDSFDLIRSGIADKRFKVFIPIRDVTDSGYVPSRYFSSCRASTHRALVEVGKTSDEAAIVPCGRYRGHGFTAGTQSEVVLGRMGHETKLADQWNSPHMLNLVSSFPDRCGDCIDRSANQFLESVDRVLALDLSATFFPFATQGIPENGEHA